METQYIYLFHLREFIKSNENIYKIGKTKQNNNNRLKQYPKGSILLHQTICVNCDETEKELIKIFKNKFKHCTDIGNEYFKGEFKLMIEEINKYITNLNSTIQKNIFLSNDDIKDNNLNDFNSYDIWNLSHIDTNMKYQLLNSKNKFSTTLEFILENDKNCNVIINILSGKSLIFKNNKFIDICIKDIIKETFIKLHKILTEFYNELFNDFILDFKDINNDYNLSLNNSNNIINHEIYDIYCKKTDKTICLFTLWQESECFASFFVPI
jgi:hypothetical protein